MIFCSFEIKYFFWPVDIKEYRCEYFFLNQYVIVVSYIFYIRRNISTLKTQKNEQNPINFHSLQTEYEMYIIHYTCISAHKIETYSDL